jgi:prepilin-type N-terminal cleavage/methylation domain-containing protein
VSRPRRALHRFFSSRTPGALRELRDAGEEGFTLIELVVVMIIMPLVVGVLFYAIFVTLQSEAHVSTKVTDSVDSQISSEFYVRDVQSATLVTLTKSATTPSVCGTGTRLLVSLAWPSGSGNPTGKTVVSYWTESGGTTLVREACKTGSTRPSTTTSRDFSSTISPAHVACVSGKPTCATTATRTWVPAQWVSNVTVAVAEPKGKYRYNLSASPRVSNTSGSTVGTPKGGGTLTTPTVTKTLPTLFLLARAGHVIREDSKGTSVTVQGTTAIENGGYITLQPHTSFTSTKGETTGPTEAICKTTTTCDGKSTGTARPRPATWVHVPKLRDPLATLPDPPEEALGTTDGCPSGTVKTLRPGRYTCEIKVRPNTTLVLAKGAYELEGGLSLKNAGLTGKSGVFLYLPCSRVDTWASSCTEGVTTAGGSTTIQVSAMATGLYQGIWYWQNAGDNSPVAVHAGTTLAITGIMYAPSAAVSFNGGPGSNTVGAVVANTLDLKNGTFKIKGF